MEIDGGVDNLVAFQNNKLNGIEKIELFSLLIKEDMIDELSVEYKRVAKALIDDGYMDKEGTILVDFDILRIER